MNVASIQFLAACAVAAILFQLLPPILPRRLLLTALNAAFLVPFVPNRRSWLCIAAFVLGSYALVALVKRFRWVVAPGIAVVVAAFVIVKRYSLARLLMPADFVWEQFELVELVGLSYMLFKFIHVLVDRAQEQLEPIDLFAYLNYQLAFFTLLAGPIQRYNDFHKSWAAMDALDHEDPRAALNAWGRILIGMVKIAGLGSLAWYVFHRAGLRMGDNLEGLTVGRFLAYFYTYPIFMYFNFSGYTDVALGSANLFGFRPPENFNRPYLARNVIDFWNRWHMSLTFWIRDYVFMTTYKVAVERTPGVAKYLGYGLLFFALFLAGVWHGSTYGFAVFGIVNGLGAAVNQLYGDVLRTRLGRAGFQRYLKIRWIETIAIVVTLHYFSFSMLFFSSGVRSALRLLEAFWLKAGEAFAAPSDLWRDRSFMTVLACLAAAIVLLWFRDAIARLWSATFERVTASVRSLYVAVLSGAAVVVLVFLAQWILQDRDPVVVYMGF